MEENLGRLIRGMETFSWKPTVRNFDVLLVTQSSMNLGAFADFLKYLGAEIHQGTFLPSMPDYFLFCDGLNMGYRLRLKGEKHLLGHEKDETEIALKP